MGARTFNIVVVLFWLSTMTWLVVAKVVPLLDRGDPPPAQAQLIAEQRDQPPVCWGLRLNGQAIGWAATKVESDDVGSSVHSRVHFDRQAMDQLPGIVQILFESFLGTKTRFEMTVVSQMNLDSEDALQDFQSEVLFDQMPQSVFRIEGDVMDEKMELTLFAGNELVHTRELALGRSLIGDEFSPEAYMPNLYEGRTWTEHVYNPLPMSPLSASGKGQVSSRIVQAKVARRIQIDYGGESVDTWVVEYRDANYTSGGSPKPVGKMWVRPDGRVLRQEVVLLGSRLRFDRLSPGDAVELSEQLAEDWRAPVTFSLDAPAEAAAPQEPSESGPFDFWRRLPNPLALPQPVDEPESSIDGAEPSPDGQGEFPLPDGPSELRSSDGQSELRSPDGQSELRSPDGQSELNSPATADQDE